MELRLGALRFLNGLSGARHQGWALPALSCALKYRPSNHTQKYELLDAFSLPYGQPCLWQLIMDQICRGLLEVNTELYLCGGGGRRRGGQQGRRGMGAWRLLAPWPKQLAFTNITFLLPRSSLCPTSVFSFLPLLSSFLPPLPPFPLLPLPLISPHPPFLLPSTFSPS